MKSYYECVACGRKTSVGVWKEASFNYTCPTVSCGEHIWDYVYRSPHLEEGKEERRLEMLYNEDQLKESFVRYLVEEMCVAEEVAQMEWKIFEERLKDRCRDRLMSVYKDAWEE
jgi:hypothetical protein